MRHPAFATAILLLFPLVVPACAWLPAPAALATRPVAYVDGRAILKTIETELPAVARQGAAIEVLRQECGRLKVAARSLPPAVRPSTPLSPQGVYERNRRGVMIVAGVFDCGRCSRHHADAASGFMISEDGLMVTNHHVVCGKKNLAMAAMDCDGVLYPIQSVVAVDPAADVAIVQLAGKGFAALSVRADEPVGAPVTVISHPESGFWTVTTGIVSRYFVFPPGGGARVKDPSSGPVAWRRMSITADYGGGSSGAPVFNAFGEVVGLVSATHAINAVVGNTDANHARTEAQMVVKITVPAEHILRLLAGDKPAARR